MVKIGWRVVSIGTFKLRNPTVRANERQGNSRWKIGARTKEERDRKDLGKAEREKGEYLVEDWHKE